MSTRLFPDDVKSDQRLFAAAGFYCGSIDGDWGPKTDAAAADWGDAFVEIRESLGELDSRTESTMRTILPAAQALMRRLITALRAAGIDARAIDGTRGYAEQDALFRQGRYGNPGPVVTYARGGQSNHNFGLAVDLGIFAGGRYLNGGKPGDLDPYKRAGDLSAKVAGLEWGGLWPGKKQDLPHYQAATDLDLPEVRRRFESREIYLTPWTPAPAAP